MLGRIFDAVWMVLQFICFVLFCFRISLIYNQRFKEYIIPPMPSLERNENFKTNWQAANSFRATKSLFISRPSAENQISMKIWRFCFLYFYSCPKLISLSIFSWEPKQLKIFSFWNLGFQNTVFVNKQIMESSNVLKNKSVLLCWEYFE